MNPTFNFADMYNNSTCGLASQRALKFLSDKGKFQHILTIYVATKFASLKLQNWMHA